MIILKTYTQNLTVEFHILLAIHHSIFQKNVLGVLNAAMEEEHEKRLKIQEKVGNVKVILNLLLKKKEITCI